MEEIWKDVEGFVGVYKVSSMGRVKRLAVGQCHEERILKGHLSKRLGYYMHTLRLCGKYKLEYAHRLVARAFIPNPYNKKQVNHIDLDKTNNYVKNLEWCTFEENMRHAFDNKTWTRNVMRGKANHKSKPVVQYDVFGNEIDKYESIMIASRESCVNRLMISKCCRGILKTAGGYFWTFDFDQID